MKPVRLALVWMGICVPALAGCGSSSSPPFTVRCAVHRLATGVIRVDLTLTNTTSSTSRAFIYGPPLSRIRHINPALEPASVSVIVAQTNTPYVGFAVPHVRTDKPTHINLRLSPPLQGQSIVASSSRSVNAGDSHVLDNPDCVV